MEIILVLIIISLVHLNAMGFVYRTGTLFYKKSKTNLNIYDIIHSQFSDFSCYNYTKNYYLLLFIFPLLNFNKISYAFLYEFFIKFMIIIFFRAITICCTILPRNSKFKVKINKNTDFWTMIFHRTIGGGCFDKIYSGHLAFGLLLTLLFFKYNFLESSIFNITLFALINIIHFFILAITRSHYTVDMVIAIFMTLWVHGVRIDTLLL